MIHKMLAAVGLQTIPADQGGPKPAKARSSQWPAAQHLHLLNEPVCQVCGTKNDLEVHHKLPYHEHPELELVQANMMTMCRTDHLFVGHRKSWLSYNPTVDADAAAWRQKIKERP